ncbi:MAG: hypothetical protein ACOYVG_12015 [Bacteroidota bacterium]
MTWLFMFFAGSLKANVSTGAFQLAKTGKTIIASKTNPADLPVNPSEPIPLPEDPESCIAELEDQATDDKKICSTIYFIQLLTLQQTTEIQAVQSFHYTQAIQQRIAIPLFVLHHSWKSYLS